MCKKVSDVVHENDEKRVVHVKTKRCLSHKIKESVFSSLNNS